MGRIEWYSCLDLPRNLLKTQGGAPFRSDIILTSVLTIVAGGCSYSDPGWRRHTVFQGRCCTDGTRFADFDRDGAMDIVTSLEETGGATLLFRTGSQWSPVTIGASAIKRPEDTLPVDVNGDGFPDLLASQENRSHKHTLCLNPGNAADARRPDRWRCSTVPASEGLRSWILAEPIRVPGAALAFVTAGKTSEDGKPGSVALLTGSGADPAGWRLQTLDEKAEWVMSMMVADINGDGREDVAFVDRKGWTQGLSWLEQPADPADPWPLHQVSSGVDGAMEGQRYGELFLSLEHAGRWQIVAYRLPDGRVAFRLPLPADWCEPRSFAMANFDGDPADEAAVLCTTTRNQSARALLLDLDGGEPRVIAATPGNYWSQTKYDVGHAVDMDGDSDLDLLTDEEVYGGEGLGVIWYENPAR
jgi:hypothetical protein